MAAAGAAAAPEDDYQRGLTAYGRGDVVGAMQALRPAADAGHARSRTMLAFILDRADFVDQALPLYRAAAEQDDPEAHLGMANYYLTGRGVAKDEKAALRHFSKAAELGNELGITNLAGLYITGSPSLADGAPQLASAAVRRAADKGHLPSMDALEKAYTTGRWDIQPDAQQAAAWKAKAAALRAQRAAVAPPAPKASR